MFRLLQLIDIILFFLIFALGLMSGLSGGGVNPWFQRIGKAMMALAFATIGFLIGSEIVWRMNQPTFAIIILILPIVIWIGLIILLQIKTKFFYK